MKLLNACTEKEHTSKKEQMIKSVKHLILVPRLDNPGGIANYYTALRAYLDENYVYLSRGKSSEGNFIFRLFRDYAQFRKTVRADNTIKSVTINSSLGFGGFFRDALFVILTPRDRKKIVFFRGWDQKFEKNLDRNIILKKILQKTYLRSNSIIVLSSDFKKKLIEWGYKGQIIIESTVVDENLLKNTSIDDLLKVRSNSLNYNALYLGNLKKEKGVFELIEAIEKYNNLNSNKNLVGTIAGSGNTLQELKNISVSKNLPIDFLGYVKDDNKAKAFIKAHFYVFPSIHGEGIPNSVLEAMAFGLPILTTRVGGLPDFFEEGKMGFFLENRDPEYIARKIEYLLERPELMKEISIYNYNYAKEHFYASKVAVRLKNILSND